MKSEDDSLNAQTPLSKLTLEIQGLGHIPALKNSMFSIVDKENRQWKKRCVEHFVSQLLSASLISVHATPMLHSLPSLIASLPQDDSWKDITEINIRCQKVAKGLEGATIEIVPL